MTDGDGDSEPLLRVPPWLPGGEPAGHHAAPDPIEPVPAPVPPEPTYLERHASPLPDDDPPTDRRRRWILVAGVAVVLLLLPTVLIVSLDNKNQPGRSPAAIPSFADTALPGPSPDAAPSSVGQSPPLSPSGTRSSSRPGLPPVTAGGTRTAVPFGPVTIEAEAPGNALHGSARVDQYPGASGGSIVHNIGDWGDRQGPGILLFQNVIVPADGAYTLTFFFVDIDNEASRTAVITVLGGASQSVPVQGSSTCCTPATVRVTLQKGSNIITFGNETGHAPSIDRIVLSLP